MDCDNNPQTLINETHQLSKTSGKKRKRKSKFADALSKPKPKYDPNIKDYEKYFDEYYKLNCEDVIGDIPCRFKYRQVVPNDFGLSTEEILFANERELNKWCSLKKSVQIRPDHVEKYDQIAYKKKAQNINLKKRIFPSLFFKQSDEASQFCSSKNMGSQKMIKKKEPCNSRAEQWNINKHDKNDPKMIEKQTSMKNTKKQKSSRNGNEIPKNKQKKFSSEKKIKKEPINDLQILLNKKRKRDDSEANVKNLKILEHFQHNKPSITDARLIAYGINPKRFKNKLKYEH